ncbi:54S ribosomal protein L2, mitochondrial, partial [Lachnellula occidentalis]
MLLPRLQPPLRAALTSIARSGQSSCLNDAFAQLAIRSPALTFVRHASHAQQGAVNKAKDGPGKRLGAKKSGEQYVIPGNIIFRQRGTHWFPGENCAMGRDHTIYATESGYVKYYKDPETHPKRQYIGVVFERAQVLPLPRNSMRRRKLNMVATQMETPPKVEVELRTDLVGGVEADGKKKGV